MVNIDGVNVRFEGNIEDVVSEVCFSVYTLAQRMGREDIIVFFGLLLDVMNITDEEIKAIQKERKEGEKSE